MAKQLVAMILAGGKGTCLYQLTRRMPNQQSVLAAPSIKSLIFLFPIALILVRSVSLHSMNRINLSTYIGKRSPKAIQTCI